MATMLSIGSRADGPLQPHVGAPRLVAARPDADPASEARGPTRVPSIGARRRGYALVDTVVTTVAIAGFVASLAVLGIAASRLDAGAAGPEAVAAMLGPQATSAVAQALAPGGHGPAM